MQDIIRPIGTLLHMSGLDQAPIRLMETKDGGT